MHLYNVLWLHLPSSLYPFYFIPPTRSPWQSTFYNHVILLLLLLLRYTCYMSANGIFIFLSLLYLTQYEIFPVFCIIFFANYIVSLFFMSTEYSLMYIYYIFFICSSVNGHWGWLHSLTIVNSIAINMGVHVSELYTDLYYFHCNITWFLKRERQVPSNTCFSNLAF
jgi:hypothetical protein